MKMGKNRASRSISYLPQRVGIHARKLKEDKKLIQVPKYPRKSLNQWRKIKDLWFEFDKNQDGNIHINLEGHIENLLELTNGENISKITLPSFQFNFSNRIMLMINLENLYCQGSPSQTRGWPNSTHHKHDSLFIQKKVGLVPNSPFFMNRKAKKTKPQQTRPTHCEHSGKNTLVLATGKQVETKSKTDSK